MLNPKITHNIANLALNQISATDLTLSHNLYQFLFLFGYKKFVSTYAYTLRMIINFLLKFSQLHSDYKFLQPDLASLHIDRNFLVLLATAMKIVQYICYMHIYIQDDIHDMLKILNLHPQLQLSTTKLKSWSLKY